MKKVVLGAVIVCLALAAPCVQGKATESLGMATETKAALDIGAERTQSFDITTEEAETVDAVTEATDSGAEELTTAPELSSGKVVDEGTTRMRYLDRVGASIHIMDDGTATVTADAVSFAPEITNLLVVAELQQMRNGTWYTLRTYRYFTGDNAAIISETCEVARGYYYRVVNTTTAYAGSDSETRVLESPEWNFFVPGTRSAAEE